MLRERVDVECWWLMVCSGWCGGCGVALCSRAGEGISQWKESAEARSEGSAAECAQLSLSCCCCCCCSCSVLCCHHPHQLLLSSPCHHRHLLTAARHRRPTCTGHPSICCCAWCALLLLLRASVWMSSASRLPSSVLSLKRFVLRQDVLALYRSVVRATQHLDADRKSEIREHVKWEIRVVKSAHHSLLPCPAALALACIASASD